MPPTARSPDRQVRARTRAGRLAALDAWVVEREPALLRRAEGAWREAVVVDVGYGESPVTTVECARALRGVAPGLAVVGLERDPARVEQARAATDEVRVVGGGFDALAGLAPARLVRAVNVVRAYQADEVGLIHERLGAPVLEGGLVIEGSSDTEGHVTVVHLLRKTAGGLAREALLFHTDFSRGFSPWLFRDWLPRDLRRSVKPGTPIHRFLTTWGECFEGARRSELDAAPLFDAAGRALASADTGVVADAWCLEHGYLAWRPADGVP